MTDILQRDATRLWSKNRRGAVVMAVQYVPSKIESGLEWHGEYNPIYVGFDGEIPRELDDVLEENKQLKENALRNIGYDLSELLVVRDEVKEAVEAIHINRRAKETKKWYQFWK